jgi:hypothetical protein
VSVKHVEGCVRTCDILEGVGDLAALSFAFLGRPISTVSTFSVYLGREQIGINFDLLGHASRVLGVSRRGEINFRKVVDFGGAVIHCTLIQGRCGWCVLGCTKF